MDATKISPIPWAIVLSFIPGVVLPLALAMFLRSRGVFVGSVSIVEHDGVYVHEISAMLGWTLFGAINLLLFLATSCIGALVLRNRISALTIHRIITAFCLLWCALVATCVLVTAPSPKNGVAQLALAADSVPHAGPALPRLVPR